jgi:hypothetical protein
MNNSLQSRYRLERDKIHTFENDSFYFAYQIVGLEFHVTELYIPPEKRGVVIRSCFDFIYEFIKLNYPTMLYIVSTVTPKSENGERVEHCENMLMSLLKYKFKLISAENGKITIAWEIDKEMPERSSIVSNKK